MGKVDGCIFCDERANITGEHLWSDWFGKMLGPKLYTMVRKSKSGDVQTWHSRKLNSESKVVCAPCNNGWMSVLEGDAKQVIQDMAVQCKHVTLRPRAIRTIVELAFLKAVVADHSHDNRDPFFSTAERQDFRKTRRLPLGVQMWLGSLVPQHGVFKSMYVTTPGHVRTQFEMNIFTYSLGHLVIQLTIPRWLGETEEAFMMTPILQQGPEWNEVSIPMFPINSALNPWPANAHMGRELIGVYAQRWKDLTMGNSLSAWEQAIDVTPANGSTGV